MLYYKYEFFLLIFRVFFSFFTVERAQLDMVKWFFKSDLQHDDRFKSFIPFSFALLISFLLFLFHTSFHLETLLYKTWQNIIYDWCHNFSFDHFNIFHICAIGFNRRSCYCWHSVSCWTVWSSGFGWDQTWNDRSLAFDREICH